MIKSILSAVTLFFPVVLANNVSKTRPNIILIMSDDQDRQLQSLDYMPILQREMIGHGTQFVNHYATVSNCCPSRASLLRGQMAHNNNITHVRAPGGNYDKWIAAGEDNNYLPHWIKAAGYRAEYVGKFLNGYSTANFQFAPKGWDYIDSLLEPYINNFNNVVMSENGGRPRHYPSYHQTDVVRVKGIARLQKLLDEKNPFYLAISPFAPHTEGYNPPVPLARHQDLFPNLRAPRGEYWNPPDAIQQQKSSFVKGLPLMNATRIEQADELYRARIQSLQGLDEIIGDVISTLEKNSALDNTYVIYTTDNGYHIGSWRLPAGKALPYISDSNLPLVVRGPGIPKNYTSQVASAHLDFAPTFLDIMGVENKDMPELLDGRSLLHQWKDPNAKMDTCNGTRSDKNEILNIEFWGDKIIEIPSDANVLLGNNSYKTLRFVSEENKWLYIVWCTNEVELYNTSADPWELSNLARNTPMEEEYHRVMTRLNAVLLVTKSCVGETCRNPWSVLQPPHVVAPVLSLDTALHPRYDSYFASFPSVHFNECILYQDEENEMPFYPEGAENDLGKQWRNSTLGWVTTTPNGTAIAGNAVNAGGPGQRDVTRAEIMASSRELTDAELGLDHENADLEVRDLLAGNPPPSD